MTCITNTPSQPNHLISKGYGPTLQSHLHADALFTVCKLIPTQNAHPTNPNPPLFNKQPPHLSTPPNFSCTNPTLPPHSEDQIPAKRNILFITTDQMRFDALDCNGGNVAKTLVIDNLPHTGINYQRTHNQNVICMPARGKLGTPSPQHSHYGHANPVRTGPYLNREHVLSVYSRYSEAQYNQSAEELPSGPRMKGDQIIAAIATQDVIKKFLPIEGPSQINR